MQTLPFLETFPWLFMLTCIGVVGLIGLKERAQRRALLKKDPWLLGWAATNELTLPKHIQPATQKLTLAKPKRVPRARAVTA